MSMIKWLIVLTPNQLHHLKAAYLTEGFGRGWEAREKYDQIEVTGKGIVIEGFDAVKEAEKIMEGSLG
jgi:hypothetical protein